MYHDLSAQTVVTGTTIVLDTKELVEVVNGLDLAAINPEHVTHRSQDCALCSLRDHAVSALNEIRAMERQRDAGGAQRSQGALAAFEVSS